MADDATNSTITSPSKTWKQEEIHKRRHGREGVSSVNGANLMWHITHTNYNVTGVDITHCHLVFFKLPSNTMAPTSHDFDHSRTSPKLPNAQKKWNGGCQQGSSTIGRRGFFLGFTSSARIYPIEKYCSGNAKGVGCHIKNELHLACRTKHWLCISMKLWNCMTRFMKLSSTNTVFPMRVSPPILHLEKLRWSYSNPNPFPSFPYILMFIFFNIHQLDAEFL